MIINLLNENLKLREEVQGEGLTQINLTNYPYQVNYDLYHITEKVGLDSFVLPEDVGNANSHSVASQFGFSDNNWNTYIVGQHYSAFLLTKPGTNIVRAAFLIAPSNYDFRINESIQLSFPIIFETIPSSESSRDYPTFREAYGPIWLGAPEIKALLPEDILNQIDDSGCFFTSDDKKLKALLAEFRCVRGSEIKLPEGTRILLDKSISDKNLYLSEPCNIVIPTSVVTIQNGALINSNYLSYHYIGNEEQLDAVSNGCHGITIEPYYGETPEQRNTRLESAARAKAQEIDAAIETLADKVSLETYRFQTADFEELSRIEQLVQNLNDYEKSFVQQLEKVNSIKDLLNTAKANLEAQRSQALNRDNIIIYDNTLICKNQGNYISIIGCRRGTGDLQIPDNIQGLPVKRIEKNAFSFMSQFDSIKLPKTLIFIGSGAFYAVGEVNNTEIKIPKELLLSNNVKIGRDALRTLSNGAYPSNAVDLKTLYNTIQSRYEYRWLRNYIRKIIS